MLFKLCSCGVGGWSAGTWPALVPTPQALFAAKPRSVQRAISAPGEVTAPLVTVLRGSSNSRQVQKPLAQPHMSDILRHFSFTIPFWSELTSYTGWETHSPCQISFFFSMAQTPSHPK